MRLMMRLAAVLALCLVVGACGDKPQEMSKAKKSDVAAYQGASGTHTAPGWKAGDATSWDTQLKARAQYGQNEYSRSSAP
jgi:hypothetical protein